MKIAREFPEGSTAHTSIGDVTNMMFYSPGFAKTDAANHFMVAHLKGLRDYYAAVIQGEGDLAEVCQIINEYTKNVPPKCAGIRMVGVDPNGLINVESIERYQNEWIELGIMTAPADIKKHIDTTYLEYAWSKLGKI